MMERWGQPYPRPVQPPPLGEDDLRALALRHAGTARSGSLQYLADMARELQGQIIEVSDSNDSDENSWLNPDFSQSSPSPTPEGVGGTPDDSGQSAQVVSNVQATLGQSPVASPPPLASSNVQATLGQSPVASPPPLASSNVQAARGQSPVASPPPPLPWPATSEGGSDSEEDAPAAMARGV